MARGQTNDAENGELVRFELGARSRIRRATARVTDRLGNPQDQRATSLIAIHAHGIPDTFPEAVLPRLRRPSEPDLKRREDLRHLPLRHHRPGRRARPRRRGLGRGGPRSQEQSRRLGGDGRHRRRRRLCPARQRARQGGAARAATRSISRTASCRCCPSASPTISARCSRGDARACLAVRMVFDKDGRKRGHRFLRGLMRSAASARLRAGASRDRRQARRRRPVPCSSPCSGRSGALMRASSLARTERGPLDLDLPERKILLDEQGPRAGRRHPSPARCASADRGVHDRGQCRRRRGAGGEAHAADLSRARPALEGEAQSRSAEFSATLGLKLPKTGTAQAGAVQPHPRRDHAPSPTAELVGEVDPAQPGAGRIQRQAISAISD